MNKEYKTIGEIVWHNLCHTITVCRDYNNYSEGGMPYVIDHFIIDVRDSNGKLAPSPITKTGIRNYMPARKSEFYDGTTHCDKGISDQEFIESIKKELGEEPKQQELFKGESK